jgi:hypothetical protein
MIENLTAVLLVVALACALWRYSTGGDFPLSWLLLGR